MKFTLEIELGNDAMQSPTDVQESLRLVRLDLNPFGATFLEGDERLIFDVNGNRVGKWQVSE